MVDRITEKTAVVGPLVRSVAGDVKGAAVCAAAYFQKRNFRKIGKNVSRFVSRNPVQAMVTLTAIGFLGGMLARRR